MRKILLILFFASLAIAILLFIKQKNAAEQGYEGKKFYIVAISDLCAAVIFLSFYFLFPHIEKYFSLSWMFPAAQQTATAAPTNEQTARPTSEQTAQPTETPFLGSVSVATPKPSSVPTPEPSPQPLLYSDDKLDVYFTGIEKAADSRDHVAFWIKNKTDSVLSFRAESIALDGIEQSASFTSGKLSPYSEGKVYILLDGDTEQRSPKKISTQFYVSAMGEIGNSFRVKIINAPI